MCHTNSSYGFLISERKHARLPGGRTDGRTTDNSQVGKLAKTGLSPLMRGQEQQWHLSIPRRRPASSTCGIFSNDSLLETLAKHHVSYERSRLRYTNDSFTCPRSVIPKHFSIGDTPKT